MADPNITYMYVMADLKQKKSGFHSNNQCIINHAYMSTHQISLIASRALVAHLKWCSKKRFTTDEPLIALEFFLKYWFVLIILFQTVISLFGLIILCCSTVLDRLASNRSINKHHWLQHFLICEAN